MTRASPLARLLLLALALAAPAGCKKGGARGTKTPSAQLPDAAKSAFARGVKLMAEGAERYDDALAAFRQAAAAAPDLWEAHLNIGILEMRRARLSQAATALERSVKVHPSPAGLEALGEVYTRQGRAKQAVALYERALRESPGDLELRNRLAVALHHAGRLEEATAELRAILGRDAGNMDAYSTLAAIWIEQDKLDMAELLLARGLARHPQDPRLLTNMGLIRLRRGDDQAAFESFEKASAADPTFLAGRLNKAAVFLRAGDHAHAREELEAVLAIEPGNTQALLGLGVALRLSGDQAGARKSWQRLLDIDPQFAPAHFNLAVLDMDFADHPQDARTHLERYLALVGKDGPRSAEARDRLALLDAMKEN